jgi:hypothetical protein
VFLAAATAAFVVLRPDGSSDKSPQSTAPPPLQAASLAGAKDFDPQGGDGEHPEAAHRAIDGNSQTYWYTSTYNGGVWPPGKTGVGVYVWTKSPVEARRIEVTSTSDKFGARVYGATTIPGDLQGWGRPLAKLKGARRMEADLPGRGYSQYLIWIYKLPAQGFVHINEVKVLD